MRPERREAEECTTDDVLFIRMPLSLKLKFHDEARRRNCSLNKTMVDILTRVAHVMECEEDDAAED